jgi:hypothetical protein
MKKVSRKTSPTAVQKFPTRTKKTVSAPATAPVSQASAPVSGPAGPPQGRPDMPLAATPEPQMGQ